MATYGDVGDRTVKARKNYECNHCRGVIPKGTEYTNYREGPDGSNTWQGREHLDCLAAWWQVDMTNILKALGQLPSQKPDTGDFDIALVGAEMTTWFMTGQDDELAIKVAGTKVKVTLKSESDSMGRFDWSFPHELRAKLVHCKNVRVGNTARDNIQTALTVLTTALVDISGDPKATMLVSNLLQQIHQIGRNVRNGKNKTAL